MSDETDEKDNESEATKEEGTKFAFLPTIDHWKRLYASNLEDQRALRVFKDYEPHEKLRRLQAELILIKDGKVAEHVLDRLIGRKRKVRYGGYIKWAQLMLLWMTSKK